MIGRFLKAFDLMRVFLILSVALALPLSLTDCGGGHRPPPPIIVPPPPPPQPSPNPAEEYREQVQETIEKTNNPETGSLKGTIQVSGLTILDPESFQPAPPESALTFIVTRIIDPEDDVGSVANPDPTGTFIHANLTPLASGFLTVSMVVGDDLNGDGVTRDPLSLKFPVTIKANTITTVNITISEASVQSLPPPDQLEQLGPPPRQPAKTVAVQTNYFGPDGERRNDFAMLLWLGRQIRDRDLNGKFEIQEGVFEDKNNDGLPDSSEEILLEFPREQEPPTTSFEGVIVDFEVVQAGLVLEIREQDLGQILRVLINERTVFLISDKQEDRFLTAPVKPEELIGRKVFVEAAILRDGKLVALIVIVEQDDFEHT